MDTIRKEKKHKITPNQLKDWLSEQDVFTLHRASDRRFKRSRVMVVGLADQYDADLMDMSSSQQDNDGYRYVLVMIDVFSRYLWMEPLRTKTAQEVCKAFDKMFMGGAPPPRRMRTDRGREFVNKETQHYFKNKNIHLFFTGNEIKAGYAERVIKTMKKKIFRMFTHRHNRKYIDKLQDLVSSYNRTYNSAIRMAPKEVNERNEKNVWFELYLPNTKKAVKRRIQPFRFNIGDTVRMSLTRRALEREYDEHWTKEVFRIRARSRRQGQPIYKLEDFYGEPIEGTCYEAELQRATFDNRQIWEIDKVLDTRGKGKRQEKLVRWVGLPKKFDSWIPASNIQ